MTPEEGRQILDECQSRFIRNLEDNNALDKAAKILLEELKATEIKPFNANGEVIYSKRMKAHGPRLKAIELLIQLYGLKAPEKHEHSGAVIIERRLIGATTEKPKEGD